MCETDAVFAAIDAALDDARLAAGGEWAIDVAASPFAATTADPEVWASVLGLDCAVRAVQTGTPDDRLVLVAWTGPRMAFVIRSLDGPSTPYASPATVSVGFDAPRGEYLRSGNSLWGGTLGSGETIVVGHLDFNLGIAAKTWSADAPPFDDEEPILESERVAIAAVRAAGGRNVGVAQPPESGSEEGYVAFVSPTGQILVADVAPLGWFDPLVPRYVEGTTTVEMIDGIWILQPPANGTGGEMVAFADALISTDDC